MRKNIKFKQYGLVTFLVVICFVLVGLIYTSTRENDKNAVSGVPETQETAPSVEEDTKDMASTDGNDVKHVNVQPIDTVQNEFVEVEVIDIELIRPRDSEAEEPIEESIEEAKAGEPEKPDTTPPEDQPVTDDDLTNPDVVPEYAEEETTYILDPEPEEPQDEVRGSNQVPDSENPFLQDKIPSNGDGGEINGEDYGDGEWGTGDKF